MIKALVITSSILLFISTRLFGQVDALILSFVSRETAKTAFPLYYAFDNDSSELSGKEFKKGLIRKYDSISKEIARHSKEPTLYLQRGIIKEKLGVYNGAKEDYDHAFQLGYRRRDLFMQLGKINYILGFRSNSIIYFNSVLRKDSTDAEAYLHRGLAILYNSKSRFNSLKERCEEALPDFTRAVNNRRNYKTALIFKGYANYILSSHDDAIDDLTKAIELSPKKEIAFLLLGKAYLERDESRNACETFAKAIDNGFTVPDKLLRKACGRD